MCLLSCAAAGAGAGDDVNRAYPVWAGAAAVEVFRARYLFGDRGSQCEYRDTWTLCDHGTRCLRRGARRMVFEPQISAARRAAQLGRNDLLRAGNAAVP